MSRQLTIKMEVKAVDDVEREKRETKEGGRRWRWRRRRRRMQQASRRCCCWLRVTGDGGKVSETPRKVAKQPQKVRDTEQRGRSHRLAAGLQHFINEHGSLSG